ncbi:MAG TPA: PP2C family protein-serine/threonine phosphatase [Phycisphaerales bacterium]|nr:PP2C family protein-serine/threonine phosphatase [Phycisphaerales bacterium]
MEASQSGDSHASHALAEGSREFWAAFDAERARILRRRMLWYSGVMMFLLAIAVLGNLIQYLNPTYADGTPKRNIEFELISVGGGFLAFAVMFVLVRVRKPDRRRLVSLTTIISIVAAAVITTFYTLAVMVDAPQSQGGTVPDNDPTHAHDMVVINTFFVQAMACLLIPMPMRESSRFSLPAWLLIPLTLALIVQATTRQTIGYSILGAVVMLLPMLWSAWRYREMDARFTSHQRLAKFEEVASELAYARRIHEALFPPFITRGPIRVAYTYEPMREIGGDFLFVWPLHAPPSQSDAPITIVLIDVSGHGVAAALAVNRFHGELRRFFAASPQGTPAELITALNAFAHEELAPQAVFATAMCVQVDPRTNVVLAANAGHPPALHRSAAGAITPINATATMLGVLPPDLFASDPCELSLSPGDTLLMYTDGLSETAGDNNEFFGVERIAEVLKDTGREPHTQLARRAASFRVGSSRDDLLVVQVTRA